MSDFFFIYAEADRDRARDIAAALTKRGASAAADRTVPAGQRYDAFVAERLAAAKAVVVVWSETSINDPKLIDEAAAARDQGKAAPVRIDAVEPPLGFRQLQTADLADWGKAQPALDALASALLRARDGDGAATISRRRAPPFLTTAKFWLFTLLLAVGIGAIFFLSPEGRAQMAQEASPAERGQLLATYFVVCFAPIALARALLHLSARIVGRMPRAYFSAEFLVFLGVAVLGAAAVGITGGLGDPAVGARASFLTGFGSGLTLLPLLMALGVFLFRSMRRLLFGRVRGASA